MVILVCPPELPLLASLMSTGVAAGGSTESERV